MATTTKRRVRRHPVRNAIGLLIALIWVFPAYWMVNSALLPEQYLRTRTPQLFPFPTTFENFSSILSNSSFWSSMRVSLSVTLLTVAAALFVAFLAAVAVSRFKFLGGRALIISVMVLQMIPAEALFISQFRMLDAMSALNSILGLTLLYVAMTAPFTLWLLRGFVQGVPVELEEAAVVDGCSKIQAFVRITLPLLAPGLIASGIFAFITIWNEYTLALVIMTRPEFSTLPLWLQTFSGVNRATDWGGIMAGSTLIAIPVIIMFIIVQTRLGATTLAGAVKG